MGGEQEICEWKGVIRHNNNITPILSQNLYLL